MAQGRQHSVKQLASRAHPFGFACISPHPSTWLHLVLPSCCVVLLQAGDDHPRDQQQGGPPPGCRRAEPRGRVLHSTQVRPWACWVLCMHRHQTVVRSSRPGWLIEQKPGAAATQQQQQRPDTHAHNLLTPPAFSVLPAPPSCRYERAHMSDGRRVNRWYLVDQHGSSHLAVIGVERDTKDGHYIYNAVSGGVGCGA